MKRSQPDNRMTPEADARLDRLVDEALREAPQGPSAAVKARVMAAWDQRHAAGGRAEAPASGWKPLPPLLRPAAALAGAFVIVLGVFLAWQHVNRQFDAVDRHRKARTTAPAQPGPQTPAPFAGEARAEAVPPSQESQVAVSPRPRRRYITVEMPLDEVAEVGPHLPGAPAGELGDPIAPMTGPPPIALAPIDTAPSVSEIARPVTEFPADNQPPAEARPDGGKSGGPPR